MLQVFRIINKIDVVNSDTFFIFSDSYTRGNNVKLIKPRADTNIRLHIGLLMIGIVYQMMLYVLN